MRVMRRENARTSPARCDLWWSPTEGGLTYSLRGTLKCKLRPRIALTVGNRFGFSYSPLSVTEYRLASGCVWVSGESKLPDASIYHHVGKAPVAPRQSSVKDAMFWLPEAKAQRWEAQTGKWHPRNLDGTPILSTLTSSLHISATPSCSVLVSTACFLFLRHFISGALHVHFPSQCLPFYQPNSYSP